MKRIEVNLSVLAESKQVSVVQLVFRWTTLQPGITVVLAGAGNAEQAIKNAGAANVISRDEEMKRIQSQLDPMTVLP